jgi:hypothetical protein
MQSQYSQSDSGDGLEAVLAIGCLGSSGSGRGLFANDASFCIGQGPSGGTAIAANIATGCFAIGGTKNVTYKYICREAKIGSQRPK